MRGGKSQEGKKKKDQPRETFKGGISTGYLQSHRGQTDSHDLGTYGGEATGIDQTTTQLGL